MVMMVLVMTVTMIMRRKVTVKDTYNSPSKMSFTMILLEVQGPSEPHF